MVSSLFSTGWLILGPITRLERSELSAAGTRCAELASWRAGECAIPGGARKAITLPQAITFDCYDTLVDFAIDPKTVRILGSRAKAIDVDAFLADFAQRRVAEEADPAYRPYRAVLCRSLAGAMTQFGLSYRDEDGEALVAAIPTFGPYPDVPDALNRLHQRCRLVILSNSDDDLIAGNVRQIGVRFDR
jgi:2-haloacid dehalogenase